MLPKLAIMLVSSRDAVDVKWIAASVINRIVINMVFSVSR